MLRPLFFLAIGMMIGSLLMPVMLEWFIRLTREPYDAYIRSLCDDPEGRTR